ncbi:MAG TPA: DUF1080 domain-containing protein, partial [Armatimonadota bacterium]|nr:DUF1080 domain-containing protein [Armatimonadota bacterium]
MKRIVRLLAAAALCLAVLPAAAAQQPNTLTRSEIEDGWILLFDGETPFGWAPRGEARWAAAGGVLTPVPGSGKGVLSTTTEFPNYRLKVDFWIDDVANSGIFLRCPTSGLIDGRNAYELNIYDRHDRWPTGSINEVARTHVTPHTTGHWNTYEVEANGPRF